MYTWRFISVIEQKKDLYVRLEIKYKKPSYTLYLPISNKDLLLKHFRVKDLYKIQNLTFNSRSKDPNLALEILLIEIKTGKRYKRPDNQKVFDQIAIGLANMKEPNLSEIDSETIVKAILSIWTGQNPKTKWGCPTSTWINQQNQKINKLSKGVISLEKTKTPAKHLPGVLGPAYFIDIVTIYGRRETLLIGPYSRPVVFVNKNIRPLPK